MKAYCLPRVPSSSTAHVLRVSALRSALALFVLVWMKGAQAVITVGPEGQYPHIQDGIDAALAEGGDEVRVENLGCIPERCFFYNENVDFEVTNISVQLSGGWDSTFQSQPSGALSQVRGINGTDAPIIRAMANGAGSITVRQFYLVGTGTSAGYYTHGLLVGANNSSFVVIAGNTISGVSIDTSTGTTTNQTVPGGAGLAVRAADSATIDVFGNAILSNVAFGTDTQSTYAGGAWVATIGSGHIVFEGNTLTNNTSINASGGGCRGGGLWAASLDTSSMALQGNTYSGNSQFDCTHGATGDAAEIDATNTAVINVYDETWTNNNVPSDPGVYEVYMQADVSSHILAQNGLITHGTWGGLLADSIASGSIDVSNYTVADNPSLGVRAIGTGTQIWNTLIWNDGTGEEASNGAIFANSLSGVDPLFVDSSNGNYRLSMGSPAIDTGSNTPSGGLRALDLGGNPRPVDGVADIGAYEYQYPNDRVFENGFE